MYNRAAATAVRLLEKFGQAVTVKRIVEGEYDPMTGDIASTEQVYTGRGAVLGYDISDMAGGLVQANDRRVYIAPDLGATPEPGDKLVLADGSTYTVISSSPLSPAGTVVLHDVQVRA